MLGRDGNLVRVQFDPLVATDLRPADKLSLPMMSVTDFFGDDPNRFATEVGTLREAQDNIGTIVEQCSLS